MDIREQHFMRGLEQGVVKEGAAAAAAQIARSQAARSGVMGAVRKIIQKRPLTTAAGAAAIGVGGATAVEAAKERQEELAAKRERIRQILMARLMQSGYYGGQ